MQRVPMTPEGHKKLEAELKLSKSVLRPGIVKDIEEARAHGDISENAEFEDAKHRQALLEGRIQHLDSMVAAAEIIDVATLTPSDRVVFGTRVKFMDSETEEELTYRIVGTEEVDIKAGCISFSSPIGKAMIGRFVGDEVTVKTPKGVRTFEILEVHYS
jgi:transcription elongation factor GreA